MGKAKKRLLHKSNTSLYMTREGAVNEVFNMLQKPGIHGLQAQELVTLFGLSALELSEAGVSYEDLKALEMYME